MAMRGKLVTLKEQAGEAPNGSSFMITTAPTPELDATNLIVGQVGSGGGRRYERTGTRKPWGHVACSHVVCAHWCCLFNPYACIVREKGGLS